MDHTKAGKQMYAECFRAWQQQHLGSIKYDWPEESKARFLENQRAAIVTLAAREAIVAFAAEELDCQVGFLLRKVANALQDKATLMELAASALLYYQFGFPGLSVKQLKPDVLDMEEVYATAE